jgi:hypothetical protein
MKPKDCLRLLQKKLADKNIAILRPDTKQIRDKVMNLFEPLGKTDAWGNVSQSTKSTNDLDNVVSICPPFFLLVLDPPFNQLALSA